MDEVGAVLITGGVAALIALWGVASQRALARRRATVDYITRLESDKDVLEANQRFIELAKAPGGLAPYAEEDREKEPDTQKIKVVLNTYELVAIGVQRGVMDFELYKRWHCGGVLRYWGYAKPFAERLRERTGNQALYHEFEVLARWMGNGKPRRWKWWSHVG